MAVGERTYLDHNATSPLRPEAAEAVARALALPGNPSSVHAEGRAARAVDRGGAGRGRGACGRRGEERRLHERRHGGEQHGAEPGACAATGEDGRDASSCRRDRASLASWRATGSPPAAVERIPVDRAWRSSTSAGSRARLDRAGAARRWSRFRLANNETGVDPARRRGGPARPRARRACPHATRCRRRASCRSTSPRSASTR